MIKEGAALVETSADIVEQLGGLLAEPQPQTPDASPQLAEDQLRVIAALGGDLRSIEQIARDTGDDTGPLMATLLQLELAGLLEQLPGGYQLTGRGSVCLRKLLGVS